MTGCNHPVLDKGVCYYCGTPGIEQYPSTSKDHLSVVFDVSHLEGISLAYKCVYDTYAALPEEEKNKTREAYRKASDVLRPIIDRLSNMSK